MILAGWVNRQQLQIIEYLEAENRVLRERLGVRRIRFTDAERRRLARKAYAIGRKALFVGALLFIVSPLDIPNAVPVLGELSDLMLALLACRWFLNSCPPGVEAVTRALGG